MKPIKNALTVAVVLAATPVAAQPGATAAPGPSAPCAVTIARAPDDVKAVVEQWVRAEPKCTTALEVRIVPTEGGLYLLARDDYGRVRERVVPDAQSAGVLVASWVAADSSAPPPNPYDVRQPAVAPDAPPPAAMPPPSVMPPISSPEAMPMAGDAAGPGAAPVVVATSAPAATGTPKWLSFGGMFAMSGTGGGGIRGELDLKTRKYATLGLAGSISTGGLSLYGGYYGEVGQLDTTDSKLVAYLSLNTRKGNWHLRAAFGLGLVYTQASLRQPGSYMYQDAEGLFPTGEATVAIGRELVSRWMLYAAPVVTMYMQEYQMESSGGGSYYSSTERRGLDAMMMIGLRHRL